MLLYFVPRSLCSPNSGEAGKSRSHTPAGHGDPPSTLPTCHQRGPPMTTMNADVYYDPYDFEIDTDPYPVWKRLRDERPLYYNERYDFYAVSRFDDVDRCSIDWETYISSKGTLLELIKSDMEIPPGSIIFEDPPMHHIHRRLPVAGLHAAQHQRPRAEGPGVLCPQPRSPGRARAGSTSSPTSAPRCPCAPSACCSAFPRPTRKTSATASTTACA